MELKQIEQHWKNWAEQFGQDIRATEKSKTRKLLEVDALIRAIESSGFKKTDSFSILEAGCGTGHNCLALAEAFPKAQIQGFDYIPEMVANAEKLKATVGVKNVKYKQGNLLDLAAADLKPKSFDIVFTNRCIINLNTHELQREAVRNLSGLVSENGALILAENPMIKFEEQNQLRKKLDLPPRSAPEFNLLIDESGILKALDGVQFKLKYKDDFSALHDVLLYVLLPKIGNGEIDYDHPILEAAKDLCPSVFASTPNAFGNFGQNRLYLFARS